MKKHLKKAVEDAIQIGDSNRMTNELTIHNEENEVLLDSKCR